MIPWLRIAGAELYMWLCLYMPCFLKKGIKNARCGVLPGGGNYFLLCYVKVMWYDTSGNIL